METISSSETLCAPLFRCSRTTRKYQNGKSFLWSPIKKWLARLWAWQNSMKLSGQFWEPMSTDVKTLDFARDCIPMQNQLVSFRQPARLGCVRSLVRNPVVPTIFDHHYGCHCGSRFCA